MCSNLLGQIGFFFIGAVKSFCAENNVFITPIRYPDSLSTKYILAPQNIVRKAEMVNVRAAEGFITDRQQRTSYLLDIVLKL